MSEVSRYAIIGKYSCLHRTVFYDFLCLYYSGVAKDYQRSFETIDNNNITSK